MITLTARPRVSSHPDWPQIGHKTVRRGRYLSVAVRIHPRRSGQRTLLEHVYGGDGRASLYAGYRDSVLKPVPFR